MTVSQGESAPSFRLPSTERGDLSLEDLLGRGAFLIIGFYPKDNTSG